WLYDRLPTSRKKAILNRQPMSPTSCTWLNVRFSPDGKHIVAVLTIRSIMHSTSHPGVWNVNTGKGSTWFWSGPSEPPKPFDWHAKADTLALPQLPLSKTQLETCW